MLDGTLPALAPGESVDVVVSVPGEGSDTRGVAWITLADGDRAWSEMGIPPLQVATATGG